MMRTLNTVFSGSGVLETFFAVGLDTDPRDDQRRNDFSFKNSKLEFLGRFLCRQWGLCPRACSGDLRRVRHRPSLRGATPAGAVHKGESTLTHATDDSMASGKFFWGSSPCFSLLWNQAFDLRPKSRSLI